MLGASARCRSNSPRRCSSIRTASTHRTSSRTSRTTTVLPLSGAMTLVTHGVALGCQAATIRRPRPGQRLPRSRPESPRPRRELSCSRRSRSRSRSWERRGRSARRRRQVNRSGEPRVPAADQLRRYLLPPGRTDVTHSGRSSADLFGLDDEQRLLYESVVSFAQRDLDREPEHATESEASRGTPGGSARSSGSTACRCRGVRRCRRDGYDDRGCARGARLRLLGQRVDLLAQRAALGL